MQWSHLPRYHVVGKNTRSAWVFGPIYVWVESESGEKNSVYERYGAGEILVFRISAHTVDEEMLKIMEDDAKDLGPAFSGGALERGIGKYTFTLLKNCVPVTKSQI